MGQGAGLHAAQSLLHLAREAADRLIVEPIRDGALLRFLQPLHGALLLKKIAFVLDFGFDRLELVADFGGEIGRGLGWIRTAFFSFEESWIQFPQDWSQLLYGDLGTLQ